MFDDFADFPNWPMSLDAGEPKPPTVEGLHDEKRRLIAENITLEARIECNNKRLTEIRHLIVIRPIGQKGGEE